MTLLAQASFPGLENVFHLLPWGFESYDHVYASGQRPPRQTFEQCFDLDFHLQRKRKGSEWTPFNDRVFGANWFRILRLEKRVTTQGRNRICGRLSWWLKTDRYTWTSLYWAIFVNSSGNLASHNVSLFHQTLNQPWNTGEPFLSKRIAY